MVCERKNIIEIWKPITKYEELYLISNLGNVFSILKNKIRKPKLTRYGYLTINLKKDNKYTYFNIHRLVAKEFIENLNNYPIINHINGIKTDNRVENLEWCTYKHNSQHSWDMRRGKSYKNKNFKLSKEDINIIRYLKNKFNPTDKELSNIFNVTYQTIGKIVNFKIRRDI